MTMTQVSCRRVLSLFFATLLFGGLTACFDMNFDSWDWGGYNDEYEPESTSGNLQVQQAGLSGDLGPTTNLNHSATEVDAWSYSDSSQVSTTVDTGNSAAMTVVEIDGPLDHPDVRVGERVTIYDSRTSYARNGVGIDVLGCAGSEVGYWEYDTYADNVVVWVERRYENPRVLRYTYRADYDYLPDYASSTSSITTVEGSFDVELEEAY